jgi:hypothetical protein
LNNEFVEESCRKLNRMVYWVVETQTALPTGPRGGTGGGGGAGAGQEGDRNVRQRR